MPRTKRIYAKLHQLGISGNTSIVSAGELKPAGIERLAMQSQRENPSHSQTDPRLNPHMVENRDEHLPLDHPALIHATHLPAGLDDIIIRGAQQHNLKKINVRIPGTNSW